MRSYLQAWDIGPEPDPKPPAPCRCVDGMVWWYEAPQPGGLTVILREGPCPTCSGGERHPEHRRAA